MTDRCDSSPVTSPQDAIRDHPGLGLGLGSGWRRTKASAQAQSELTVTKTGLRRSGLVVKMFENSSPGIGALPGVALITGIGSVAAVARKSWKLHSIPSGSTASQRMLYAASSIVTGRGRLEWR